MPVVVWEWMTDRGLWNPYPPDVSNYIEDKYKIFEDRKPFPGTLSQVDLQHANKDYNRFVIDFGYFSSRNKITGSNRPIRREFCDENSPAAKGILWQWQGDDFAEWVCYSFDVAACLENAANSNYSMIDLDRPPFHLPYIIRLSSMEQVRNGSGFTRKIRRLDTRTPYAKSSSSSHLNGSAAVTSVMVSGFQNSSYTSSYVSPVHHVALSQPAIWNTPAFPNSSFHPSTSQGFAVVSRATAGTNSAQPTSASPLAWPTQYAHGVAAAASSANVGYPGGTCQNMPSQLSSTGAFTIGSAPPTNTQPKRVRKLKQSQPTTLPSTSYSQGQNSISPMDQQTAQTLTTSNQTSQFSFPLSPFGFSQQQVSAVAIVQQPQPSAMSVANQSSWMSWRNPTSATQSSVSSGSATMWSQLRQGSGYITSAVAKLSGGIVDNLVSGLEAIGKRKRKSGAGSSNQTSSQQQQQQPFAHASFNVNAPLPLPPFAVSPQPPPMYNTPVNSAANCNGAAPAFGFVSPPHPSSISLSSLSVPTSAASVTPRCSSRRLGQQPDKADGPTWNAKRARGDFGRIQRVDQLPESSDATGQEASVVIELSKCRHKYHLECVCSMYDNGPKSGSLQCPTCKYIYGEKRGDCPDGEMTYSYRRESLAGYPGCGSIVITYNIRNGMKNNKWFKARGFPRYGYLPDNEKGNWVLELLKVAWQRRLTFTIGTSVTTGEHDVVVWNEIHHKTSPTNEHGHGYPDSNYLDNVIKELAAQGVTERDSDDRDMSCDS